MRYWAQCGDFFRECRRHFRNTGAILPSSRFLARALVAQVRRPHRPSRILEVGPGTGSVTKEILRFLQPGDQLDAVEDLPGEGVYDYIVSGLPLNNFPVSQVRKIFRAYNRLLKPGGTLTYYEYV